MRNTLGEMQLVLPSAGNYMKLTYAMLCPSRSDVFVWDKTSTRKLLCITGVYRYVNITSQHLCYNSNKHSTYNFT